MLGFRPYPGNKEHRFHYRMADPPLLLLDLPSVPRARVRNWAWSIAKMEFFARALNAICIMLSYLENSAGALGILQFCAANLGTFVSGAFS